MPDQEPQQHSEDYHRELIGCLPLKHVEYAFAYGSGVITQQNEKREEKMVDFVVVTKNSLDFHRENLQVNPKHYSFFRRYSGAAQITLMQSRAARVYYNTMVQSKGRLIKYGVIDMEDLKTDLLDWQWLYIAGRLHKPVLDVIKPNDQSLKDAIIENRKSAMQVALLQLPDYFTFEQLYAQIASVSYTGDFRMYFGEDRQKIPKLVIGAMDQFMQTYVPLLSEDPRILTHGTHQQIEQDSSSPAIYHRLNLLPSSVLNSLCDFYSRLDLKERDIEEVVFSMAHRHDVSQRVADSVASIVAPASRWQSLKNARTAGIVKTVLYSSSKIMKMLRSIR